MNSNFVEQLAALITDRKKLISPIFSAARISWSQADRFVALEDSFDLKVLESIALPFYRIEFTSSMHYFPATPLPASRNCLWRSSPSIPWSNASVALALGREPELDRELQAFKDWAEEPVVEEEEAEAVDTETEGRSSSAEGVTRRRRSTK